MKRFTLQIATLTIILFAASCSTKKSETNEVLNTEFSEFKEVPRDQLLSKTPSAQAVYAQLKQKYMENVLTLKKDVEANGAKLLMFYFTPECGNSLTPAQRSGKIVITEFANANRIPFKDISNQVENKLELTLMPKDGHWSKSGTTVIASELASWLKPYAAAPAAPNANLQNKPSLFGDLEPNEDKILDGGKDLPYRLITNSQGLRMDADITFPKKKQRIILMGDSEFFCPFLDNQDGITAQLQAMYPEAEIVNTSNWGYSVDDYVSLYNEKVKYLEGDIIVMGTNGNDVIDLFFTNRLLLGRNKTNIKPSQEEIAFYKETFNTK